MAAECEFKATAHGKRANRSDDGLAAALELTHESAQRGRGAHLGCAKFLDVSTAGEAVGGADDDDCVHRAVSLRSFDALGHAAPQIEPQPVYRGVVHRDHGDIPVY